MSWDEKTGTFKPGKTGIGGLPMQAGETPKGGSSYVTIDDLIKMGVLNTMGVYPLTSLAGVLTGAGYAGYEFVGGRKSGGGALTGNYFELSADGVLYKIGEVA